MIVFDGDIRTTVVTCNEVILCFLGLCCLFGDDCVLLDLGLVFVERFSRCLSPLLFR